MLHHKIKVASNITACKYTHKFRYYIMKIDGPQKNKRNKSTTSYIYIVQKYNPN